VIKRPPKLSTYEHFIRQLEVWTERYVRTGDPQAKRAALLCQIFAEEERDRR
jgi:hypothetical protein